MSSMLSYYPFYNHVVRAYTEMNGNQAGIMGGDFTLSPAIDGIPHIRCVTGRIPAYHKALFSNPTSDPEYHLGGYGFDYGESLTRMMGESIERYASIMDHVYLRDEMITGTYAEVSRRAQALPLDWLRIYEPSQLEELHKRVPGVEPRWIREDEPLDWVPCVSLLEPNTEMLLPAQIFCMAYRRKDIPVFVPSYSTGTATHRTIQAALAHALYEIIQIDAFMLMWYCGLKARRVTLDDSVMDLLRTGNGKDISAYAIECLEIEAPDIPVPSFVSLLRRKTAGVPNTLVGVQGGLDVDHSIVRSVFEAYAITYLLHYQIIYNGLSCFDDLESLSGYTDLDSNVAYWANLDRIDWKAAILDDLSQGGVDVAEVRKRAAGLIESREDELPYLLRVIREVSSYAAYKVITPPELKDKGWHVVRVCVPELLSMCYPGFPPRHHPRLLSFGGVRRDAPHPLP